MLAIFTLVVVVITHSGTPVFSTTTNGRFSGSFCRTYECGSTFLDSTDLDSTESHPCFIIQEVRKDSQVKKRNSMKWLFGIFTAHKNSDFAILQCTKKLSQMTKFPNVIRIFLSRRLQWIFWNEHGHRGLRLPDACQPPASLIVPGNDNRGGRRVGNAGNVPTSCWRYFLWKVNFSVNKTDRSWWHPGAWVTGVEYLSSSWLCQ